jgi:ABC-type transport system involved in multi-copper enzyme maturation permease subunit
MIKHIWFKDLKAELFTWKSLVWLLATSIVYSITSYLLLTNKELSLMDQTEMLWLFSKIIIGTTLLIIIIDASSLISSEFENETIENLFLTPLTISDFITGKLLLSITLWGVSYLIAIPYMIVTSSGSGLAPAFLGYIALFGTLAVVGFTMLIYAISLAYKSMKNTLTTSFVILLALTIPALFSTTLKNNTMAKIFGEINPIDNIFASLDNVLVDYKTSISQNLIYIIPVLVFCILMFLALFFSVKTTSRRGILKD